MSEYRQAEEAAKKDRLNIWRYGDFTGDDDETKEFGMAR